MKKTLFKYMSIILFSMSALFIFGGCDEERDQLEVNDNLTYYDSNMFAVPHVFVSGNTATITTIVTISNGLQITGYGHCWTTQIINPTIQNSKTVFGPTSLKSFTITSTISNYSTYTSYYLRAYVNSDQGIIYDKTYKTN